MSDKASKDREQKAAEAEVDAFKQDLGPFVIAAEKTRMPMAFTDARKAGNPIIFANDTGRASMKHMPAAQFFISPSATPNLKWCSSAC